MTAIRTWMRSDAAQLAHKCKPDILNTSDNQSVAANIQIETVTLLVDEGNGLFEGEGHIKFFDIVQSFKTVDQRIELRQIKEVGKIRLQGHIGSDNATVRAAISALADTASSMVGDTAPASNVALKGSAFLARGGYAFQQSKSIKVTDQRRKHESHV